MTITEDIVFLRCLAADLERQFEGTGDELGEFMADRLHNLADRLQQIDNLPVDVKLDILAAVRVQSQDINDEPIPDDYHCGNAECFACNAATGRDANGSPVPPTEETTPPWSTP